jgi:SAM-dependent methyltransferase
MRDTDRAAATFDAVNTAPDAAESKLALIGHARPDALDDPTETALFARLAALAVKTLRARHVLDVGCGCGTPTLAAARAGAERVVGIDLSASNVELARRNVERARLQHCVSLLHASWDDVRSGRVDVGPVDLLVANPPYVPAGRGLAVDGGPSGTRLLEAIIHGVPRSLPGLALLFGSISNPLHLLDLLARRGFEVIDMLVQSVPFGAYTSVPSTLAQLRMLRARGRAWFCDVPAVAGCAPHAYLTLGIIAKRAPARDAVPSAARLALGRLLADYQRNGPSAAADHR